MYLCWALCKARGNPKSWVTIYNVQYKELIIYKGWRGCWETGVLYIAGGRGEYKMYNHYGKEFGSFLQNCTCHYHVIQQLHSWAFNPEKWNFIFMQQHVHACHSSFIWIDKNLNQPRYLSTGDCFNKWYIYTKEDYSATKRNKLLINTTQVNPLGNYAVWKKKTMPKGLMLYDSIYITFWKWLHFRFIVTRG